MGIFKDIFWCLLLLTPSFSLAQNKQTDPVYKQDGSPSRLCFYNKNTSVWTITSYGIEGKIDKICYYDSTGSRRQGTYTKFDDKGNVAYIL